MKKKVMFGHHNNINMSLRLVNNYLGVTISEEGGSEETVRARLGAAWGKWRDLSGVISDKKMPRKLKIKLYMTVIRPVLLHGAECWTVGKKEEHIIEKPEMIMLRTIKGVTLRDKIKSVDIRKELGVTSIQEKVREMRLSWYGQRMEENNEVRAVVDMIVPGKRPRGRPRGRWMDCVRRNMRELRITPGKAQDRTFWRSRIRVADPTWWENARRNKKNDNNISLLFY